MFELLPTKIKYDDDDEEEQILQIDQHAPQKKTKTEYCFGLGTNQQTQSFD